jgi:citronellyl-CoA dehydrogenase
MGRLGYLGLREPPAYGGAGLDLWYTLILAQELVKRGSIGTAVGLLAHMEFAFSVIDARGTPEQTQELLAPAIRGEQGRADRGHRDQRARRRLGRGGHPDDGAPRGGDWVVSGSKTFITNGTPAASRSRRTPLAPVSRGRGGGGRGTSG